MPPKTLILLTAVVTITYAAFSVHVKRLIHTKEQSVGALELFDTVPDFTLTSIEGDEVVLQDAVDENHLVLINFWATWCTPCRMEIPQLTRLYEEYQEEGFTILAINVGEEESVVRAFMEEHPVPYTILIDSEGGIAEEYGIRALPTSLLVDSDRDLSWSKEGLAPELDWTLEWQLKVASE